ncbi:SLT domain-containing protein (plasmid) [Rhodovastum atsumiense]|uniref:hypothetical protein n=1 Tax=Rhodovastum atsumiense TaxID=504468 RepID=UPI0020247751|nr:hypothetical protein [Rhodovastum atsumiense]CAH2605443.1 SLT domain-containing protein [Rhodovastum atsumiense]
MTFRVPVTETATRVGRFTAGSDVVAAMRTASAETGARFDVLLASAAIESGLRPDAKAGTSSASGMYQFIEQTWLDAIRQYGPSHGLGAEAAAVVRRGDRLTVEDPELRQRILDMRHDPRISSLLAGDSLRAISDSLATTLGRAPDVAETYLGHFLGIGGASQMLQAAKATPNRPAAELLPAAARANHSMFYASDGQPLTVTQFIDKVRGRVERAYADLGTTMPSGGINLPGRTSTAKADAPEAGASGWGSTHPARVVSAPERLMLSTLAEIFTRVDRSVAPAEGRRGRRQGLPGNVVSGLRTSAGI